MSRINSVQPCPLGFCWDQKSGTSTETTIVSSQEPGCVSQQKSRSRHHFGSEQKSSHFSPLPSFLASLDLPLYTGYEPSCLPSNPTLYRSSLHCNSAHLAGTARYQVVLCFLPGSRGRQPQAHMWVCLSCSVHHDTGLGHVSSSQRDHYNVQPPGAIGSCLLCLADFHPPWLHGMG